MTEKVTLGDALPMWTIFDHPTDYPDHWVAREFHVIAGTVIPTGNVMKFCTLEKARENFDLAGLVCSPRHPSDAPSIVETWF